MVWEEKIMIDFLYINVLEKINDISTKLTSWSWKKLWADRKKGYGYRKRNKN